MLFLENLHIKTFIRYSAIIFLYFLCSTGNSNNIKVCSAENFYGNVAKIIGGEYVDVTSIISNPDADPHLFSVSPNTAKAISRAQIIIYNGADYDPWMIQLLSSKQRDNKHTIICVAELAGVKKGNNPHIWYKPDTFPKLASLLAQKFSEIEPENKTYFKNNLDSFNDQYKKIYNLIKSIKSSFSGTNVIATEPIFGYMSDALGFNMKGERFQWIIMNGSEPSPKITAAFIDEIKSNTIKILYYNNQVTDPTTENILKLAKDNNIKTIGVSETMPNNQNVIQWLAKSLEDTQKALTKSN